MGAILTELHSPGFDPSPNAGDVTSNRIPNPAAGSGLEPLAQHLTTISSRAEWAHQQLGALMTDVRNMRAGLAGAESQTQRLSAANRALGERVRQLTGELHRTSAENDEAQRVNVELHNIASELADRFDTLDGMLADERGQAAVLRSTIAELEQELDRMAANQGNAAPASGKQIQHQEALAFERSQNAQLRSALRELEEELSAVERKAALRTATENAIGDPELLERLETQIEAVREENKRLTREISELEAAARVRAATVTSSVHVLRSSRDLPIVSERDPEADRLRGMVKDLEGALDELESENRILKRTLEARDEEIGWLSNSAAALPPATQNVEMAQLRDALTQAQRQLEFCQRTRKTEHEEAAKESDRLTNEIKRLRARLLSRG